MVSSQVKTNLVGVVDEAVALGAALPLGRLDHRRQLVPVVAPAAAAPVAAGKEAAMIMMTDHLQGKNCVALVEAVLNVKVSVFCIPVPLWINFVVGELVTESAVKFPLKYSHSQI